MATIRRPLITLYLPAPARLAALLLEAVARDYPGATFDVDGDAAATLTVLVTETVDDDDPRLIGPAIPYGYSPAMSDDPTDPAAPVPDPDAPDPNAPDPDAPVDV